LRDRPRCGYQLNQEDAVRVVAERRPNLSFHTGDRVLRDQDGWFWFVDRLNDSIRRRGENISSYEVETVLAEHYDVASARSTQAPIVR
jgi:crotonobetaine/carnitine-CoA ligase